MPAPAPPTDVTCTLYGWRRLSDMTARAPHPGGCEAICLDASMRAPFAALSCLHLCFHACAGLRPSPASAGARTYMPAVSLMMRIVSSKLLYSCAPKNNKNQATGHNTK
jgi:hypothetical protein